MKQLLTILAFTVVSFTVFAAKNIELAGAEYLEPGEEIFHRMNTKDIKNGDILMIVDKRNKAFKLKAKAKKVGEKSLILVIQAIEKSK